MIRRKNNNIYFISHYPVLTFECFTEENFAPEKSVLKVVAAS